MCGVFGIFGHDEASNLTYLGLHALQHRGQESAGIVSSDSNSLKSYKQMGLGADVFNAPTPQQLPGPSAPGPAPQRPPGGRPLKNPPPLVVARSGGQSAGAPTG